MGLNSPSCRCEGNLNEVEPFAIMMEATENDYSELLAMDSFTNLKTFHFLLAPKMRFICFSPHRVLLDVFWDHFISLLLQECNLSLITA